MDTNSISAIVRDLNPTTSYLGLVVDGVPLDELLAARCNHPSIAGLLPTLLDWMEYPEERRTTWERILPPVGQTSVAPLLMCDADPGFGCILLVAEVEAMGEVVHWRRFGYASGEGPSHKKPLAGLDEVRWLDPSPMFVFERREYQKVLGLFGSLLVPERRIDAEIESENLKPVLTMLGWLFRHDFDDDDYGAILEGIENTDSRTETWFDYQFNYQRFSVAVQPHSSQIRFRMEVDAALALQLRGVFWTCGSFIVRGKDAPVVPPSTPTPSFAQGKVYPSEREVIFRGLRASWPLLLALGYSVLSPAVGWFDGAVVWGIAILLAAWLLGRRAQLGG